MISAQTVDLINRTPAIIATESILHLGLINLYLAGSLQVARQFVRTRYS